MPALEPAKRGSGQQVTREAAAQGFKTWTCTICGRSGREVGHRAARAAYQRHYVDNHHDQEVPWE